MGGDLGRLLGDPRLSEPGQGEVTREVDEFGDVQIRKFDLRHRGERAVVVDRPCRDDNVQTAGLQPAQHLSEQPLRVRVHVVGIGNEDERVLIS